MRHYCLSSHFFLLYTHITMYKTEVTHKTLHFIAPAGTSRGVYTKREIWLIKLYSDEFPERCGVGECSPLPDLSCDALPDYEERLNLLCRNFEQTGKINRGLLLPYPSILFGLEVALLNLQNGDKLFDTPFSNGEVGIPFNGLVWMGTFDEMSKRIEEKINGGFTCVKLKIGAIDFQSELSLIKSIRKRFSKDAIELRVDANGGFTPKDAPWKLDELAKYDIHSIEQPIRQKQWKEMSYLCSNTPLPIALDEELIGINMKDMKEELLDIIKPQYIVLKPSLHGGISGTEEWVEHSSKRGIGSWITSALESNIGLDAVAQLASHLYGNDIKIPQGLGTGLLYADNFPSRTVIRNNKIWRTQE